jgi:aldehyde dehydrogenase (NAD+)
MKVESKLTLSISVGVCAGICAWNGSHVLAAWKMAPAMAAGNTFVLKSSEKSPLALAAYGELLNEVRFCCRVFLAGSRGL